MAFNSKKDVWDRKITIHTTMTERTNEVLTRMCLDMQIKKGHLVEQLIKENKEFQKYEKEFIKEYSY